MKRNVSSEILTQLESYRGIVIFATNDINGLDNASMRRFKFKVEFKPLTPRGVIEIYKTVLSPIVPGGRNLSANEQLQLQGITNLTIGDFAVVRDQRMFLDKNDITHTQLINALIHEVRYKQSDKEEIGFRQCLGERNKEDKTWKKSMNQRQEMEDLPSTL